MHKQLLLAALIALGACTDLVPSTLLALSNVDPLTADPADIAISLDLPDGVALLPGSGELTLGATNRDGETAQQSFTLQQSGDVLAVATTNHQALRALQSRIREWEETDPSGTNGSLSVSLAPCRTGDSVADGLRASASVRLQQDGPFLPLIKDGPLSALLNEQARDTMEPCT